MKQQIAILAARLREVRVQLQYLPRAFGLLWASARSWTLAWGVLLLLQGVLPVATVYLTRALVDSLVQILGVSSEWEYLRPALVIVALMAATLLLAEVLRGVSSWVRAGQSESVLDHVQGLVHSKCIEVDLASYENPAYYDLLHRVVHQASSRQVALLGKAAILLQSSVTLVGMGAVLLPYSPWIPFVLLIGTLPALYVVMRYSHSVRRWRVQTTADQRRTRYYDSLLKTAAAAPEVRLFSLGDHFRSAYQEARRILRLEHLRLARDEGLAQALAGAIALAATGVAMIWMVHRVLQGMVSLGDLALFYQAFSHGQRSLRSMLENFGQVYADLLFLGDLFEFLDLEPQVVDPLIPAKLPPPMSEDIRFEHISFRYPGSDRLALENLNLAIPSGRIVSIVGPNGAGKSTLIKLLCRFYDPNIGRITIDGVDLRHLRVNELRRRLTVLFQEPVRYSATVAENIALGDLASNPGMHELEDAARASGAEQIIAGLPHGYDTLLGKWFSGGGELSVGEWQRIALARALIRDASVIILDEPTSAMDPWAEADWLDRLRGLVAGRMVMIITHRLTTARHADVIHVMNMGRIVESGTHPELLALNGQYASSWLSQRETDTFAPSAVAV
ncbi:MAG: ABC transporter ATP-binding protein [Anaerolineales bacterium]